MRRPGENSRHSRRRWPTSALGTTGPPRSRGPAVDPATRFTWLTENGFVRLRCTGPDRPVATTLARVRGFRHQHGVACSINDVGQLAFDNSPGCQTITPLHQHTVVCRSGITFVVRSSISRMLAQQRPKLCCFRAEVARSELPAPLGATTSWDNETGPTRFDR